MVCWGNIYGWGFHDTIFTRGIVPSGQGEIRPQSCTQTTIKFRFRNPVFSISSLFLHLWYLPSRLADAASRMAPGSLSLFSAVLMHGTTEVLLKLVLWLPGWYSYLPIPPLPVCPPHRCPSDPSKGRVRSWLTHAPSFPCTVGWTPCLCLLHLSDCISSFALFTSSIPVT